MGFSRLPFAWTWSKLPSTCLNCVPPDIVDIKPVNMEELTEVITAAEFHPHQCNVFVYSSSKGTIRLCDMRSSALCDRHSKCKCLEGSACLVYIRPFSRRKTVSRDLGFLPFRSHPRRRRTCCRSPVPGGSRVGRCWRHVDGEGRVP